jgi:UDPglucose--hexose-1-phosphate uridylyltransferase
LSKSEIRKHYFVDRYVVIAPKRSSRPHKQQKVDVYSADGCSFCLPGIDDPKKHKTTYEVKNGKGGWDIKVIENDFPALSLDNLKAYGYQEVIIETPNHGEELYDLSLEHIKKVIDVYCNRYLSASNIEGIRYTLVFKNEGGKAGSSVDHSHSQLIALPMVPPKAAREAQAMDDYFYKNNSCAYCDIIKKEQGGPREICSDDHWFVLAPYASEDPYEAWFIPKRHYSSIAEMHENEKESLAHIFKKMLAKLDAAEIPYNYFFKNAIENDNHHMIIRLAPRPNIWAGLELGTGIIINPMPPEKVPAFYNSDIKN